MKLLFKLIAKRYIAGDTYKDAIRVAKELNLPVTIAPVIEKKDLPNSEIFSLIRAMQLMSFDNEGIDGNIALKPTTITLKKLNIITDYAKQYKKIVWLDMEAPETIIETINKYHAASWRGNIGLALQANIKRTTDDIYNIQRVRLCKGAYNGDIKNKERIIQRFKICEQHLNYRDAVATHNKELIKYCLSKTPNYEFQALYGKHHFLYDLQKRGYRVRAYIPYGKDWYKYCIRRLKENPKEVLKLLYRN